MAGAERLTGSSDWGQSGDGNTLAKRYEISVIQEE
jgi:hypothetical protein